MREDPEDPWEDGYLRGDPRSRRSSGGSSSSAADGGISVKTLTTYLTSSTARGLNAVAALLVVAGLIAVAPSTRVPLLECERWRGRARPAAVGE